MPLVTAEDVAAVYETDRDHTAIAPFIAIAAAFTDQHLAGKGLTDATLKEIQRYLAGHFLFVSDTGVHESLAIEDVRERFTKSEKSPGLFDSRWGRTAVMIDPSGTLSELARPRPTAELRLLTVPDPPLSSVSG